MVHQQPWTLVLWAVAVPVRPVISQTLMSIWDLAYTYVGNHYTYTILWCCLHVAINLRQWFSKSSKTLYSLRWRYWSYCHECLPLRTGLHLINQLQHTATAWHVVSWIVSGILRWQRVEAPDVLLITERIWATSYTCCPYQLQDITTSSASKDEACSIDKPSLILPEDASRKYPAFKGESKAGKLAVRLVKEAFLRW